MDSELRNDPMMARLMDSLDNGKDIGHYGRLVFVMIGRHFMTEEEVKAHLTRDPDCTDEQADLLFKEVISADYSPPKREKILDYQAQQSFPIIENPEDPDLGNVYRSLKFPEHVYEHISHYREQKIHANTN